MSPPDKEGNGADLTELLAFLKSARGFDFSGYKRPSLERRIRKRMEDVQVEDYRSYLDFLEVNPDEFTELFNTILINVTDFFRDKPAWEYVQEELVPQLLKTVAPDQPLRVWCAGCASGEEAYTVAMVLAEAMGEQAFKQRVKLYATDVDEDALNTARHGSFPSAALKGLPDGLAERYFEPTPLGRTFRSDLRRSIIFGRNDLVQDAPISRIDLLLARNTLMYFTAEAQSLILGHFNFALNETGYLFLGKSEMLITHSDLFTPENLKMRVFRKVPRPGLRDRMAFLSEAVTLPEAQRAERGLELRAAAADLGPIPEVLVDRQGFVVIVNHAARALFGLGPADIGRPVHDLEVSYRPADLRSPLQEAYQQKKPVEVGRVAWPRPGAKDLMLEVRVTPIIGGAGVIGASISFEDVTVLHELDAERERTKREIETAYEELQSTVEELETTNEELQSTNEELETTNEELQSSNEELETMNEELHSTNDELAMVNDEQLVRGHELDRANLFLEGILGSLGVGVVVVDRDWRIQLWNAASTDFWGLRPDEVEGVEFMSLDSGLPVAELKDSVEAALADGAEPAELVVDAVSRRGRSFRCLVRLQPMRTASGQPYGAFLLMADADSGAVPKPQGG